MELKEGKDERIKMTRDEIVQALEEKKLADIIELIEDAEKGQVEELELVEQIGLVHDPKLNEEVLRLLEELDVTITYVTYDDEEEEDE